MVRVTHTTTRSGPTPLEVIKLHKNLRYDIVKEVVSIGEAEAQKVLAEKRKSPSDSSPLVDSFVAFAGLTGDNVVGYIQSGGNLAPYAVYVDRGHKLRNGNDWKGYAFMKAGAKKMEEVLPIITLKKIKEMNNRGVLK